MQNYLEEYRYIIIPLALWCGIQLFKFLYDRFETKKWHFDRLLGAGGMPSSHSAVVVSISVLIGKHIGISSPLFALSGVLAFIVMYDAAGVRRAVGKQAKVLNDILTNQKLSSAEKLQEMTGHTPIQVLAGALLGLIAGLVF